MHAEAREFIARCREELSILEIGSRDVNGGIRDLFPGWDYLGIDTTDGPGVNVVADGATFDTPKRFDVVVCCEVFEHTANWPKIVTNAAKLLKPGGVFMGTAAGPGRPAHNCDGTPHDGKEHYENIDPASLEFRLKSHFQFVRVDHRGADVRWVARLG